MPKNAKRTKIAHGFVHKKFTYVFYEFSTPPVENYAKNHFFE